MTFLFLSYFTNKSYFHNCLWLHLKYSQMLFGLRGFYGRRTSICETTGLNWSNMDQISSISTLWYIFLIHRIILTFYFPCGLCWRWSSSSVPWSIMGYYPLIGMIHTFFLVYVRSWWAAGNLGLYQWHTSILRYEYVVVFVWTSDEMKFKTRSCRV